MKAMLKSGSKDETSSARGSRSAQRRKAGPGFHGNLSGESLTVTSSLAYAPHTVAQRRQMQAAFGSAIQRMGDEEEPLQGKLLPAQRQSVEEEPLQGKFETAQRQSVEEEPLQGKFETAQRQSPEEEPLQGKFETAQRAEDASGARAENRTGMPDQLKAGVESLSGMSMDNVKVHYSSPQPAQLNALAYAQGTDIHLAPGQAHHLPHEAWHVVQQAEGRVQPTMQMNTGVPINDDAGLEQEADAMGAKAAHLDPGSLQSSR